MKLYSLCLVAAAIYIGVSQARILPHLSSNSQYIHSNDTIKLFLSNREGNKLYGPPGSEHTLEFYLVNDGKASHFSISGSSGDGFMGLINTRSVYMAHAQQQTITVSGMKVPQRPIGETVRFTLSVERSVMQKREAPPSQDQVGGHGGSSNTYGGGSGGSYGGEGDNNPYQDLNDLLGDPSIKTQQDITIMFLVADDLNDESKPETELTYGAKKEDETCPVDPDSSDCSNYFWWFKVKAEDEKSGLLSVKASPSGKSTPYDEVYFRYNNWEIGTTQEQEIAVGGSCCLEGIDVTISDVFGNEAVVEAENGGKGTPMSNSLKWGLIGGGIALAVIIIIVVVVYCYKKGGYQRPGEY